MKCCEETLRTERCPLIVDSEGQGWGSRRGVGLVLMLLVNF